MSPQTVKLLMMFFLATALLNITNYFFYLLYDPPTRSALKPGGWLSKPIRKFTTKHRYVRTIRWTAFLVPKDNPEAFSASPYEGKTGDVDGDYRDQSSEVSRMYEYHRGVELCPQKPPGLGPMRIDDVVSLEGIERLYETLEAGGIYEEAECAARQSVAIIIPNRGQRTDLLKFLYTLHPFLMKQQLDYQIFVIEQYNSSIPLNLGKLLNAGFAEAQRLQEMKKNTGWKCVVFHEQEIVPADSRNLYRCSGHPHQLVAYVNNRSYEYQFGGAVAINPLQFTKVNGFSNLYSGNEAVYDDLYKRLLLANYTVTKSTTFGQYLNAKQEVPAANQTRFQTIQTSPPLNLIDGLSTLTYKAEYVEAKQLYTQIGVSIETHAKDDVTKTIWNKLLNQQTTNVQSSKVAE